MDKCPQDLIEQFKEETGMDWPYETIRPMCEYDDFAFGVSGLDFDDDDTFVEVDEKFQ